MSKIHPTESGTIDVVEEVASTADRPSVWTVWKKSTMNFQGTDGFTVYDSKGKLAFRVDNYSREHKCFAGELLLMDGDGKALIALRPQILSMHDRWSGFSGEDEENTGPRTHVFSMRRRSILQTGDEAEVFMPSSNYPRRSPPRFTIEGCFRKRCCKIKNSNGEEAARITPKKANTSVILGDDVFTVVIQPGVECALVMAFVVIMDRISQKPFSHLISF